MTAATLAAKIAVIVRQAADRQEGTVPLHEPMFDGQEWELVRHCLDTGWVSSAGSMVERFERELEDFSGARHAIATVNGTAALHICLKLAGVQPGDEVLVPALSFVATANAVVYCDAVPHFVEIEEATLGVDPAKLADYLAKKAVREGTGCVNRQTGRPIRALVAMHTFGHPVDLAPLLALCARYGIELVEDAAEALGSRYQGAHIGTFAKVAALSFNGNKIITTGGGGAILTGDAELARRARHLTTTAKLPHRWGFQHDEVGFNYRLPNLNAALGVAQMRELPRFVAAKRALASYYRQAFDGVRGVRFFAEPQGCQSNYWLNVLLLEAADCKLRDDLLEELNGRGIQARPAWELLHTLPPFAGCPGMELTAAGRLARMIVNIPSSASLGVALLERQGNS